MIDIQSCTFPRAVEENSNIGNVREMFRRAQAGPKYGLPEVALDDVVTGELQRALRTGRLKRGFETTLDILANERRGLAKLQKKTGKAQAHRVSRLILASSDASERLLRGISETLQRNAPRVLALALQADSAALGSLLYGADAHVKVLLLNHKDTVSAMLIAGAQQHAGGNGTRDD